MVLLLAIGAAAAAYQAKNDTRGENEASGGEEIAPAPDFTEMEEVDLLPLEQTLTLFESPVCTITFMDGDPAVASECLKQRVAEILKVNPWIGGWLGRGRGIQGMVRLYFDRNGERSCPGLLKCFEDGEIKLTRDTPYEQYGEKFDGHEVSVRCNAELMNRNLPLWKVSLIPDAGSPDSRFALVVSMSHILGDGFTFFRIHDMLHSANSVEALNPFRKHEFSTEASSMMGKDEAYFAHHVSRSPIWAKWGSQPDKTVMKRSIFFLDKEWVEGQKEACTKMMQVEAALLDDRGGKHEGGPGEISEDSYRIDAKEQPEAAASVDASAKSPTNDRKKYAVSFAAEQAATSITTNDIVTSWFFRATTATVGLMPYNFRSRAETTCDDNDAGNYAMAIPFTPRDYVSPVDIQVSRQSTRRAYSDDSDDPTSLPPHKRESRYSISVDWRSFQHLGGLELGPKGECKQELQLPFYDMRHVDALPKAFSFIHLFNAGPNGEPAMSVIVAQDVMKEIEGSGMVKERLFMSAGTSHDEFATAVAETAAGRRKSVFAPLLDTSPLSGINGEVEDET